MVWKKALSLKELQTKLRHPSLIEGQKILFIWHDNQVHAIQASCPHLNLPLAKGKITESGHIICPFHKSEFDLKSGDVQCWSPWPPAIGPLLGKLKKPKNLKIYKTEVREEVIYVEL